MIITLTVISMEETAGVVEWVDTYQIGNEIENWWYRGKGVKFWFNFDAEKYV